MGAKCAPVAVVLVLAVFNETITCEKLECVLASYIHKHTRNHTLKQRERHTFLPLFTKLVQETSFPFSLPRAQSAAAAATSARPPIPTTAEEAKEEKQQKSRSTQHLTYGYCL